MFNVKDLEDAIFAMEQGPKLPKKVKMKKLLARHIITAHPPIDKKLLEVSCGYIGDYMGLLVEIDDEIDSFYEVIY